MTEASRDKDEFAQCFGKEAYRTPQLAYEALARRKAFKSKHRGGLNAYRCPYCNQYHHGNGNGSGRNKKGKFRK